MSVIEADFGKKKPRPAISKKTRFEVFKRDNFTCQYCGAHPPHVVLEVDHIDPLARGGAHDMDNFVTACEPCNRGKGARQLSAIPEGLAEKAARIEEAEAQLSGYTKIMLGRRQRLNDQAWDLVEIMTGRDTAPRAVLTSLKNFIERLGFVECVEAAEIAANRITGEPDVYRYFFGVCWRKVRAAEEVH